MNSNLKKFTTTALLIALILLMGLVPYVGYIPIGPIKITLICIPVIIGTLALGLRSGLILGFVFGITSLIQVWYPGDILGQTLLNINAWKLLLILFIPRLLVPVVTYYVYRLLETKYEIYFEVVLFAIFTALGIFVQWTFLIPAALMLIIFVFFRRIDEVKLNYGLAALFGSLTNTVFFLSGVYFLYLPDPGVEKIAELLQISVDKIGAFLAGIALTNGLPEAILALFLCVLILIPLNKMGLTLERKKDYRNLEERG